MIKDILNFYHSEITHPGITHAIADVPRDMLNRLIGPKGSNIRHIQNNFKVKVHIPNETSVNRQVVVVGTAAAVASAKAYVDKMVQEREEEEKEKEAAKEDVMNNPGWGKNAEDVNGGGKTKKKRGDDDEEEEMEEWMEEYAPPSKGATVDIGWGMPAGDDWT